MYITVSKVARNFKKIHFTFTIQLYTVYKCYIKDPDVITYTYSIAAVVGCSVIQKHCKKTLFLLGDERKRYRRLRSRKEIKKIRKCMMVWFCRDWWVSIKCRVHWLLLSYYPLEPPLPTPYKKSASHVALCALFAIRNNKHISFAVNLGKVRNSYDQRQSLRFKFIENVEDESQDNLDAQCQSLVSNDRIVVRRG